METNESILFGDEIITVYNSLDVSELTHTYSPRASGERGGIDFNNAHQILDSLDRDVRNWYKERYKEDMDTYHLGEKFETVQQKYRDDGRFTEALQILEIPSEQVENIRIPWWNEIAGDEIGYERKDDGVHIQIGPRHSYETQCIRNGFKRSISSLSVAGIILSAPEGKSQERFIAIGIRGGKSYRNTYHINAGALGITPEFARYEHSMYDVFKQLELVKEFGIQDRDIDRACVHSRIMDYSIENGPMYNFLVETNLTRNQIHEKWKTNFDPDKAEHQNILFIPANAGSIKNFVLHNYKGHCDSKMERTNDHRFLLHPGALALAAYSGMSSADLKTAYQPGQH